ncbi:MAG: ATP-dependent helicase [Peptostreptococcaceae bacterium]
MITYRKDQIDIMNYKMGTMAVQAVPGAGKTFIITNLVANLIKDNMQEKSKILILTYMNSAVNNFKTRVKSILKESDINFKNTYEAMTIHSLAVKIIKEKPDILMLDENIEILDEMQRDIIIKHSIDNYLSTEKGREIFSFFIDEDYKKDVKVLDAWKIEFIKIINKTISDLKYKDISSSDLSVLIGEDYKGFLRIIYPIYKEYEDKLKKEGFIDFDDILILAHRALKIDSDLREIFKKRYSYIFEDECQDSNEIQGEIIKLISTGNLVRVGDINQSISGTFSNSNPKYFKEFTKIADYFYQMDMSNRSSKDILDLANILTSKLSLKYKNSLDNIEVKTVPKNMGYKENPVTKDYSIYFKEYKDFEIEIDNVMKYISQIKIQNPNKSIGVISSTNNEVTEMAEKFDEKNIEFEEIGVITKEKRKGVYNLSLIVDFLIDTTSNNSLIKVLEEIFNVKDTNSLKNLSTENIIYDEEFIKSLNSKEISYSVEVIREILGFNIANIESLIIFIKDKLELSEEQRSILYYVAFYFKHMYLSEKKGLNELYNLISDSKNNTINRIIERFYETKEVEIKDGSITLCNYHKSKGLEWDIVFLLGVNDYNFPDENQKSFGFEKYYLKYKFKNVMALIRYELDVLFGIQNMELEEYRYDDKFDLINEKIRVLYVAVTRAKEMLFFSSNKGKFNKNKISSHLNLMLTEINNRHNGGI